MPYGSIQSAPVGEQAGPRDAGGSARTVDERAEDLVRRMTLEEKIDYLGGDRAFYIRPVPRLGIPEIKMSDGPEGCRNWGPGTSHPAAVGLAATFDPQTVENSGASIARDCRARGVHILLAPGVNIQRSPLDGRNFEYMGEDPFLAGKMAASFIRGVQREGVLATVKHFAGNNQEWDRNHISSEVDERTLREIYFPAFERAVREGQVSSVMTAYNLLNGTYCSHNAWLIRDVLKREWGFLGIVMSDWSAVHDTLGALTGGLDLEMPSGKYINREAVAPLISSKAIDPSEIDEKVRRILRTLIGAGFFDRPQKRDDVAANDPSDAAASLDAARKSIVLLKNENKLLPLERAKYKRIAVIGPNAQPAVTGGYGSAFVTPAHATSLLDGIRQSAPNVRVDYHPGVRQPSEFRLVGQPVFSEPVKQEVFSGRDFKGSPIATRAVDRIDMADGEKDPPVPGLSQNYSVRWTGAVNVEKAGTYRIVTNTDDGVRVFVDQKQVLEDWRDHATSTNVANVDLTRGRHAIVMEYYQGTGGAAAQFGLAPDVKPRAYQGGAEVTALASGADVVVVAVGYGQAAETNSAASGFHGYWPPAWARQKNLVETEDSDRSFQLPAAEVETLRLAMAANRHVVVVVNAGGGIDMQSFLGGVQALIWAWYPGTEGGKALADVLFGDVNPSGKLPVTLAKRYEDYPSAAYYNLNLNKKTPYTEGVFVGYRGFDAKKLDPAFPFGFGLGYSTFAYSDVSAESGPDGSANVRVRVTNTGEREGVEIVQVYVSPPKESVPRPPRELKGFARVALAPGESREVAVSLEPRAFAYWDDHAKQWTVEAGSYQVQVGGSSRDLPGKATVNVAARMANP